MWSILDSAAIVAIGIWALSRIHEYHARTHETRKAKRSTVRSLRAEVRHNVGDPEKFMETREGYSMS